MIKIKKTYRFALYSSMLINAIILLLLLLFFYTEIPLYKIALVTVLSFFCCLFVIQYASEKFIYRLIKNTYENISLLDKTNFHQQPITTDITALTNDVKKIANANKLKIETLQIRDQYRKEFMGNIAHELKTPLFTVQSYILTLIDGALKDDNVNEKYLKRASKGVDRLIYLVEDLDLITNLETGNLKLKKDTFNIVNLIQEVFDLLEIKAQGKTLSLVFDKQYKKPILVVADKEKIRQVITNLIVNSIKYGQENGTTEVSIEPLNKHKIIIRVTDNGEGIASEHLPRLFERFYRIDKSGARSEGGSGLGLAIVKHIIEAHHQKIYIESQHGVGSEFSFTLTKSKNN